MKQVFPRLCKPLPTRVLFVLDTLHREGSKRGENKYVDGSRKALLSLEGVVGVAGGDVRDEEDVDEDVDVDVVGLEVGGGVWKLLACLLLGVVL